MQDCGVFIAYALEILQFYTKLLISLNDFLFVKESDMLIVFVTWYLKLTTHITDQCLATVTSKMTYTESRVTNRELVSDFILNVYFFPFTVLSIWPNKSMTKVVSLLIHWRYCSLLLSSLNSCWSFENRTIIHHKGRSLLLYWNACCLVGIYFKFNSYLIVQHTCFAWYSIWIL